ncbi:MAG: gamma-glutamyltransferase [Pseudomonadota bacterium]
MLRAVTSLLLLTLSCTRPEPGPTRSPALSHSVREPVGPGATPEPVLALSQFLPVPAAPGVPALALAPAHPTLSLQGGPKAVRAEFGAVTSVEPNATRAGIKMLEQGGNAIDAAVAVAYALAVTHPSAGNLGGGGFLLVRPKGGPTAALDFREAAPAALTRAQFEAMENRGGSGPVSVGVPGSVAGLELAHDRFGKLPRATVMAPAIALAEGHLLGAHQAALLAGSFHALMRDPAARDIFSRNKQPLAAGQRLVQRDLARTLNRISEHGSSGFYAGPTALALSGLQHGLITLNDLAVYRAVWRDPLRFDYRGFQVEVMPAPSAGGVALTETLLMLQALHAEALPHDSAAEWHLFLEASRRAQAERRFGVVDPDSLSAEENAKNRARWLDPDTWLRPTPIDPARATPSASVHALNGEASHEPEHTTHFSVVDKDGMVVSCTTTLSGSYGAKLVLPGTGIVLNNSVASFALQGLNMPVGGRRTVSSMAPTLVLQAEEPVLVLGTPGGDTIPGTIVQVLRHIVDHGESLVGAVDAPRVHQAFMPDEVRYEPRNAPPPALLRELRGLGHVIKRGRAGIGDANEILIQGGAAWAYADPRELGLALAARQPSDR